MGQTLHTPTGLGGAWLRDPCNFQVDTASWYKKKELHVRARYMWLSWKCYNRVAEAEVASRVADQCPEMDGLAIHEDHSSWSKEEHVGLGSIENSCITEGSKIPCHDAAHRVQ